jgi:hypothetical protein
VLTIALATATGCGGGREVVVHTADGAGLTAAELDRQPLGLLPPQALGWFNADLVAVRATRLGQQLLERLTARWALPQEAGFAFDRDVDRLWLAVYGGTQFDVVAAAQGRFDAERLKRARQPGLVLQNYADHEVFSWGPLSFSLITAKTALWGTPGALLRSLDRIRDRRVRDDAPEWIHALVDAPRAQFAGGVDVATESVAAVIAARLPGARSVRRLSVVGNLEAPGLNLATTFSCTDSAECAGVQAALQQGAAALNLYGQIAGIGPLIERFDCATAAADVQAGVALREAALLAWMDRLLPSLQTSNFNPGVPA